MLTARVTLAPHLKFVRKVYYSKITGGNGDKHPSASSVDARAGLTEFTPEWAQHPLYKQTQK